MNRERLSLSVAVGVFLVGIVVVLLAVGGFVPSALVAGAAFLIAAGAAVLGYWLLVTVADESGRPAGADGIDAAGRAWIAFCSGWWLAAAVSAADVFVEEVTRPATGVLEAAGAALGLGGISAGGAPLWFAAGLAGAGGLPVGFLGILLGFVATVAVWVTLPVVLSSGLGGLDRDDRRRRLVASAVPYVAGGIGLDALRRSYLAEGRPRLHAAGRALLAAVLAYLLYAALVAVLGYALFVR